MGIIFGSNATKGQTVRTLPQTGKMPNIPRDKARSALAPGKRISKYGNIYWETRKNRSDKKNQKI